MAPKILLHLLAQQPSPAEQFSTHPLKQICHTCAVALDVLMVLGVVVVLALLFISARGMAASGKAVR